MFPLICTHYFLFFCFFLFFVFLVLFIFMLEIVDTIFLSFENFGLLLSIKLDFVDSKFYVCCK